MDSGVIIAIILVGLFLLIVYYSSYKQSQLKKNRMNIMKDKNATLFITLSHFQGLPIAENVLCQIFSCLNEYEITANGNSFKLNKSKVTDVSITSDVDIQKSYVSSMGGTVAGGLLFGPLGAAIGGRTKEKTSSVVNNYLIFTFNNDDEIKYIAFNCTGNFKANKFVEEFNKLRLKNNINEIQL